MTTRSLTRALTKAITSPPATRNAVIGSSVETWPAETIVFGTPNEPITGTSISSATWIIGGRPVPRTGTLTQVKIYSGATATVKVKVFTRTGRTFTFVREESFAVVSGLNTITTNLAITAGDFLAVYSSTANFMKYNEVAGPTGTEFYSTAGDNTTSFTVTGSAPPSHGVRLEVQFTIDVAESVAVPAVGDLIYMGPPSPAAGDTPNTAVSASFFDDMEFICECRIESITTHATAAGLILLPILEKTASGYETYRPFALQIATGTNTYVAGTDFPVDLVIPAGGMIGHWVFTTSLSSAQSNGRAYRGIDLAIATGIYPPSPVAFPVGFASTQHQIRFAVRPTATITPPTHRVDQVFDTAIPPWFNTTNWSVVSGKARNSGTGLANRIEFRNGGYYDGTASLWVTFSGATDEIALYRRANSTEILGTLISVNAGTGLLAIHSFFNGSNTLPAVADSKTCGFTLTAGVEYKIDLIKAGTTVTLTISNPLTADTDTLIFSGKDGTTAHDTSRGFATGNPGFAVTVGTVDVSRFRFTPAVTNPKVMLFGDSITESSGSTSDATGWAQLVASAMPGGRGLVSAHSGNGSAQVLLRIEKEVRQFLPEHVIILIGTNDTDVAAWKSSIAEIVRRVESCGATCWLGAVPPEAGDANPEDEFNPWLRTNYPDQVISFDYALTTGGTGLAADLDGSLFAGLLHPNDDGYAAMFAQVQADAPGIF